MPVVGGWALGRGSGWGAGDEMTRVTAGGEEVGALRAPLRSQASRMLSLMIIDQTFPFQTNVLLISKDWGV